MRSRLEQRLVHVGGRQDPRGPAAQDEDMVSVAAIQSAPLVPVVEGCASEEG
jgi:hypothetical protein